MTPQQNIFKVLVLHNKLATEDDVDVLLQQESDPEDVIAKMVIGEMITESTGDKLLNLYRHNLQKQHLPASTHAVSIGHAGAPPAVARVVDRPHLRIGPSQFVDDVLRRVGAPVVDDDDLEIRRQAAADLHRLNHEAGDRPGIVVRRKEDAQAARAGALFGWHGKGD